MSDTTANVYKTNNGEEALPDNKSTDPPPSKRHDVDKTTNAIP